MRLKKNNQFHNSKIKMPDIRIHPPQLKIHIVYITYNNMYKSQLLVDRNKM